MLPLVRAAESLEVVDDWFHRRSARDAVAVLLQGCATHGASFWAWDAVTWTDVLGTSGNAFLTTYPRWARTSARSYAIALAYLFGFIELHFLGNVGRGAVARKVFGRAAVDQAVEQVTSVLHGWGASGPRRSPHGPRAWSATRCCSIAVRCWPICPRTCCGGCERTCRFRTRCARTSTACTGLAALGHVRPPRPPARLTLAPAQGVDPLWADWVQRWHDTSTLPVSGRKGRRNQMLRMGRWLAAEHPDIREPSQWTQELCAVWGLFRNQSALIRWVRLPQCSSERIR